MKRKTLLAIAIAIATTPALAAPQATPATPATPAVPRVSPAIPATPAIPPERIKEDVSGKTKVAVDMPPGHTHTKAAVQGSEHGVKGSVGASVGMTSTAAGDFDFNADGSISDAENVASNKINAAIKQGVAGPKFRAIDINGDKVLSEEELRSYSKLP